MSSKEEKLNYLKEKLDYLKNQEAAIQEEMKAFESDSEVKINEPTTELFRGRIVNSLNALIASIPNQEGYIGSFLFKIIGIGIILLGLLLFFKFSIEQQWLPPTLQLIAGYTIGIGILLYSYLYKNQNSKVQHTELVIFGMAITYTVSYFSFKEYPFFTTPMAYLSILAIIAVTIFIAFKTNKEIIAIVGVFGLILAPLLTNDQTTNGMLLFATIIASIIGSHILSYLKNWKYIQTVTFSIVWIVVVSWFLNIYEERFHFKPMLFFMIATFLIFHIQTIAYKALKKETYSVTNTLILAVNVLFFYSLCYYIIDNHYVFKKFLGYFTLILTSIFGATAYIIYHKSSTSKSLHYTAYGITILLLLIGIGLLTSGNFTTILWLGTAFVLYVKGRSSNELAYELIAYPVLFLSFIGLVTNWAQYPFVSNNTVFFHLTPFINIQFLTTLLFLSALVFMYYKKATHLNYFAVLNIKLKQGIDFLLPILIGIIAYMLFYNEIGNLFAKAYNDTAIPNKTGIGTGNQMLLLFKKLWLFNYSLTFTAATIYLNEKHIKSKIINIVNLFFGILLLYYFITIVLYDLSILKDHFINHTKLVFKPTFMNIIIRYIVFTFVAMLLFVVDYFLIKKKFLEKYQTIFNVFFQIILLCTLTSELIYWLDFLKIENKYTFSISILWGNYAFILFIIGLLRKSKLLRIEALVLFFTTFFKLFLFDFSDLPKALNIVIALFLGFILLTISYLYRKKKNESEN